VFTAITPDAAAPVADVRRAAAEAQRDGVRLVILPPLEEGGLLLRVIGPAVHCFAAALWVDRLAARAGLAPTAYSPALARVAESYLPANVVRRLGDATLIDRDALPPIALVAGGRYAEYVFGLRWKLLEGLHVPDPPVWDLLQVAHGPFQQLFDERMTLLVLERADAPHETPLIDRLAQLLVPERHRLIRLAATLPGACAWFEHDAQLDALVVDAIGRRGIDLADWPGKGHDGPLYDVSPETLQPSLRSQQGPG
jgi:creatinine amidohydrolase